MTTRVSQFRILTTTFVLILFGLMSACRPPARLYLLRIQ